MQGAGYLSEYEYLHIAIARARKTCPLSRLIVITDSSFQSDFAEVHHPKDYCSGFLSFIERFHYTHTVSPYWYLIAVFARLFLLPEFTRINGIDQYLYLESDVLLYHDPWGAADSHERSYSFALQRDYSTDCCIFGVVPVNRSESIEALSKYVIENVVNLGNKTEMHILNQYQIETPSEAAVLGTTDGGIHYDFNIGNSEGLFKMRADKLYGKVYKNFDFDDNSVRFCSNEDQPVTAGSLHCWAQFKNEMPRWSLLDKHELTEIGIGYPLDYTTNDCEALANQHMFAGDFKEALNAWINLYTANKSYIKAYAEAQKIILRMTEYADVQAADRLRDAALSLPNSRYYLEIVLNSYHRQRRYADALSLWTDLEEPVKNSLEMVILASRCQYSCHNADSIELSKQNLHNHPYSGKSLLALCKAVEVMNDYSVFDDDKVASIAKIHILNPEFKDKFSAIHATVSSS